MSNQLRPVVVFGAGTMGTGIAQVAVEFGHDVALVDPSEIQLLRARAEIERRLTRQGRWTEQSDSRLKMYRSGKDVPTLLSSPLVIEAVVENLDAKQDIARLAFAQFGESTIFASNTSSFSISAIASAVPYPARVVGLHFFNPVPVMQLVEVIPGVETGPAVTAEARTVVESWGKAAIVARSTPGFIVNRVARPFYGESLLLAEEHVADIDVIDQILRESAAFPMGPFELMDLVGNDVNQAVTQSVWESLYFDDRYVPSVLQRELVVSRRLGRKSGRGWYDYEEYTPATTHVRLEVDPSKRESGQEALGAILKRLGIDTPVSADHRLGAGDGCGAFVLTRGRTAEHEAQDLNTPVVVFDRPLDVAAAQTLAFSASTDARPLVEHLLASADQTNLQLIEVRDVPGLIAARVVCMIIDQACEAVRLGVCSADDVNTAMRLGTNYPLGPLEWRDVWGERYVLDVMDGLCDSYRRTRYRASLSLRQSCGTRHDAN